MTSENLPASWVSIPFADITRTRSGNSKLIKGKLSSNPGEGQHPAFSASGQDVWRDEFEYEGVAIIVSAVGARCGKCFRASGRWSAIANTHIVWPDPRFIDPEYLWRTINDESFWIRGGSAQPFVRVGETFEREMSLPPLPEQRRIVAKLDRLSARSAAARYHLARTSKLAARAKQAVLAQLLDEENAPSIPLGDLATDIRYGTSKKCDYETGATPVLRIPNVARGIVDASDLKFADFDEKERRKLALQSGDLLLIRSNGSLGLVGRSAIVDETHAGYLYAGYLIRVRIDPELACPGFVQLALSSDASRRFIEHLAKSTSGVNNINSAQIASIPIPDVSIDRQIAIAAKVQDAFARVDRLTEEAARAAHLLDRLDERLLAKAFRGELVPQDPADEPAEALLARIRQARAVAPKPRRGRRGGSA